MSPPRIMFDDGSRIMEEAAAANEDAAAHQSSSSSERGNISTEVYYEIDRVAKEVVEKLDWSTNTSRGRLFLASNTTESNVNDEDGFLCRVALQFPDELLADASEVSWLMEHAIMSAYKSKLLSQQDATAVISTSMNNHLQQYPLVFILGDTTYGSCCPDEVSANHLNANVIVHYGYACLAPTESIPVVYSFGASNKNWKECVDLISREIDNKRKQEEESVEKALDEKLSLTDDDADSKKKTKLLLLYEVKYHHCIDDLKLALEQSGRVDVVLGTVPKQQLSVSRNELSQGRGSVSNCCGGGESGETDCCNDGKTTTDCGKANCSNDDATKNDCNEGDCCMPAKHQHTLESEQKERFYIPRTIGGLEIPNDLKLSEYTMLYIGDDIDIDSINSNSRTRLLHILLRCQAPDGTQSLWSYSPLNSHLSTDILDSPLSPTNDTVVSSALSRTLRRRYFLIQKAKLATTIAILIGSTSTSYSFRRMMARTRRRIQSTGRTAYTFAVGKLASASSKLANFAEIDCFVLIACGESIAKFWKMERDEMLVPVLTPMELDVALGYRAWDGRYSCDFGDLIRWDEDDGIAEDDLDDCDVDALDHTAGGDDEGSNSSNEDQPFFSMISGKYEQSRAAATTDTNLQALPGKGQMIEYSSEAAEFLKKREYQGLEANVGQTEAKAAVLGQVGIASDYGETTN
ncbi:2-(3-amino-3-carboxypropyl)histidine synthase subunit 2 [Skeletonema marinoi]|uniref:2-(3-amino-3-carboxypropyl)histidine synthase subunit 2 n=1 Tax=Skeletonema marinoi TaxID=267567 RepID=A0AAD8Y3C9_9STRA|nr:2-(3-amino-3-carboxypropyl)histidine synthase subunit 2 [Skeletonema marinoi]